MRLEKGKTIIYVSDERFIQCKSLMIEVPAFETVKDSIDSYAEDFFSCRAEISKDEEFWGHCSNIQAWYEYNYNTNLLHSNIAFPLLRRLVEVGDSLARSVFKDEVVKKIERGYIPTIIYLIMNQFLHLYSHEEFETLIAQIREIEPELDEETLDLICSFTVERRILNVNDLIFLIEHPKINLFELLITYGNKYFARESDLIGDFRHWIKNCLNKLVEIEPKYLVYKIKELIDADIIRVRESKIYNEKLGYYETEIDFTLMDEFSILLYNLFRYSLIKYRKLI